MPQTPVPDFVADDEIIQVAWGNDVVNIIGPVDTLPLGSGVGSVANRLFDLDARLDPIEYQGGAASTTVGTTNAVTTNSSGDVRIPLGITMQAACVPVVSNGDPSPAWFMFASDPTTTDFNLRVRDAAAANPGAVAVRVNWIAIGIKA